MRQIRLRAAGWDSVLAGYATSFMERLLGIRAKDVEAVLLDTSSVHTIGMSGPIELVALDDELKVVETRTVGPNRVVWVRSARHILELPAGSMVPGISQQLELVDA